MIATTAQSHDGHDCSNAMIAPAATTVMRAMTPTTATTSSTVRRCNKRNEWGESRLERHQAIAIATNSQCRLPLPLVVVEKCGK
mmetsp:Transcript_97725/g.203926  ORF Transcript_97725/g.203926 Transcript_97725/m.203926 type:complete len:84 (-) Transcript_97725:7-258(-)